MGEPLEPREEYLQARVKYAVAFCEYEHRRVETPHLFADEIWAETVEPALARLDAAVRALIAEGAERGADLECGRRGDGEWTGPGDWPVIAREVLPLAEEQTPQNRGTNERQG